MDKKLTVEEAEYLEKVWNKHIELVVDDSKPQFINI